MTPYYIISIICCWGKCTLSVINHWTVPLRAPYPVDWHILDVSGCFCTFQYRYHVFFLHTEYNISFPSTQFSFSILWRTIRMDVRYWIAIISLLLWDDYFSSHRNIIIGIFCCCVKTGVKANKQGPTVDFSEARTQKNRQTGIFKTNNRQADKWRRCAILGAILEAKMC